jgi:hypothetical protein
LGAECDPLVHILVACLPFNNGYAFVAFEEAGRAQLAAFHACSMDADAALHGSQQLGRAVSYAIFEHQPDLLDVGDVL